MMVKVVPSGSSKVILKGIFPCLATTLACIAGTSSHLKSGRFSKIISFFRRFAVTTAQSPLLPVWAGCRSVLALSKEEV